MKTLFRTGFARPSFAPMLGQEIITDINQGPPAEPLPAGTIVSGEQLTQGPTGSGVPGLVTQQDLQSKQPVTPSPATTTDWGKILSDMAKAGATTYQGYTKAQIAEAAARQKKGLPTGLPGVPPPSTGVSTTTLVVGGLAAATILAIVALS